MKKLLKALEPLTVLIKPFVYLHELTHFLACKWLNIPVEKVVLYQITDNGRMNNFVKYKIDESILEGTNKEKSVYFLKLAAINLAPFVLTTFNYFLYCYVIDLPTALIFCLVGFFPSFSDLRQGIALICVSFIFYFYPNKIKAELIDEI